MKLQNIILFSLGWDEVNKFWLTIVGLEWRGKKHGFEGSLFGLTVGKTSFELEILFFRFNIESPLKLTILIAALILSGCVTQRRCFDKFPPPPSSTTTITETKIVSRDTTIYIRVPADTITQTDTVKIGIDGLINYPKQRLDVKHAWSVVWIENSRLRHELYQKESELAETIKDAIQQSETSSVTVIKEPYPVPIELSWWRQTLIRLGWAFLALIILAAAAIGVRRWLPF